ncbi:hypothetical protein R6Q59_004963 [Mikania micrantha]
MAEREWEQHGGSLRQDAGTNAWETRSHLEEREEGEILENNHGDCDYETNREVQPNLGADEACTLGGNLNLDNGPPNADPMCTINVGLVGHQSELLDCRPKKRPRAEDIIKDGAEVNSLDVPSLTPDLNLSPPGRNAPHRRRRFGGIATHDPGRSSGDSQIHDGVFYFGNVSVSDPGRDQTLNRVENSNVGDHMADEVDDTIRVGQLVGIDVVDFRSQIVEIIGGEGDS